MTKSRALALLALTAGGIFFPAVAMAHWLWHYHRRHTTALLLLTGAATASLATVAAALIPRLMPGGRTLFQGSPAVDRIALTFDDGPREPYTGQVLDILAAEDVRATFFVLGENATRHPETIKRMVREGHTVANHGYDHSIQMFAGPGEAKRQVDLTAAEIARAGIQPPEPYYRAPHGWLNPLARQGIESAGYRVVGWTRGVWDTANPGIDVIVNRTRELLAPGNILLLHDGWPGDGQADRSQTVAALPAIIRLARERGLEFATIGELASPEASHG